MNATGLQNYLSNVFRPIVFFDTGTSKFIPKLELSNIDNYAGNTITVVTAGVGDSAGNVYVGKEAGTLFDVTRGASNVTAIGFGAASNISNVSNSVYIGFGAGSGNSVGIRDVIAIGFNAGRGPGGSSNIYIGSSTGSGVGGTLGASNVFIGHGISPTSNVSNQLRIGLGEKTPIVANLLTNWVGLAGSLNPLDVGNKLDISGAVRIQGQLGINITPGGRTLDVNGNFRASDSSTNVLDFSNGVTLSSKGFGSVQGTVELSGTSSNIGVLRKGVVLVSAVNRFNEAIDHAASMVLAYSATDAPVEIGSNVAAGAASITFDTGNIVMNGDSETTYDYNITYFPLP